MPNIPEVHLLDYLKVIKRRKWIIIACLLFTITLVAIGNYATEPVYQATVQLMIGKEQRKSPITGEMMEYESYRSESLTFNTYFSLITSFPVLKKVVEKLPEREEAEPSSLSALVKNIISIKQFIGRLLPIGEKVEKPLDDPSLILHYKIEALRRKIDIEPVRETRLVNIHVQDNDPLFAKEIANTLANAYIEYNRTSRLEAAKSSLAWFTEQLKDMKKKVKESEAKFYEFKEKEGIFSIEGKQNIDTQRMADLNRHYAETKSKRLEVKAKIQELKKILNHGVGGRITPTIIENTVLQNLYSQLLLAEIELSELQKGLKWKHPKILEVKSRIQRIKDKFDTELKKALNNLKSEYAVLKDREESLLSTIRQYEREALRLNKKEMQYAILEREVETNKELYNLLLTKFKEANMIEDMNMANIRVVEPAVTPLVPVRPRKALNLILATIVGLMLGTGLAFFREYLDRTIKTPEEASRYLGSQVLGTIPKLTNHPIPVLWDKDHSPAFIEAYQALASNLRFCQPDNLLKTLLITSSAQKEGKSTVAANLGIAFARTGTKVLLIDSDLRLPTLHKIFNIENSSGLTEIIINVYNTPIDQDRSKCLSIGDAYQLLKIQKKTGILTSRGKDEVISFSFEEGKIVDITYTGRPLDKRLGSILVKEGKITSEMLDEALQKQQEKPYKLGYILVNMGFVEPQDLEGPLKLHATEALRKAFGFNDAKFSFKESNSVDHSKDIFDFSKIEDGLINYGQPFIEKEVASFIKDTAIKNLKILTTGSLPPNPSELIGSERMRALVNMLKERFDILIFDSPPALAFTDASALASFLDGVILVVKKGFLDRKVIQRTKEVLEAVRANVYGVVLNQVDLSEEEYYYSYYPKRDSQLKA